MSFIYEFIISSESYFSKTSICIFFRVRGNKKGEDLRSKRYFQGKQPQNRKLKRLSTCICYSKLRLAKNAKVL